MRIFLVGFMGSGKSYWGKMLSKHLELPFFDLDHQIEEQEGMEINEIFEKQGEEHFRLLEKAALYMLTESHESFVMATGGGTPCYFNNIDYLKQKGLVIWINPSLDTIHERLLKEKAKRPLLREVSDEQIKEFIQKK